MNTATECERCRTDDRARRQWRRRMQHVVDELRLDIASPRSTDRGDSGYRSIAPMSGNAPFTRGNPGPR